ncbi:rhamnogalacturonan acetylesterase [Brevundimonas sp.]|uniref:rhamnogalacturonan acetylesterase n=1 Tax=Brevundimonas sp. TaxID=1871086 RepID=UPI0028AF3D5F|nr:rhamnogalacturonan acetylesterase [Brevundimonas sp.]
MRRLAAGALASVLLAAGAASAQDQPVQADKIILVGDSTTAVGSGWGGAFCDRHVLSALACVNLGRQGRSTSTYRAEGSWDLALNEMATPGYQSVWVLIQFGHNDQPGKRSSTDLATQFPANLRAYVAEARARGARPILLTPLTRRHFKDGQLQNTLVPWAEAVRAVAVEMNTPLIDLNAASAELVQRLGALEAARLSPGAPPPSFEADLRAGNTPPTPPVATPPATAHGRHVDDFDYTHLGPEGAAVIAALVARDLIAVAPDLAPRLVP